MLLIVAIVILLLAALQSAYSSVHIGKPRWQQPTFLLRHEILMVFSNIIFIIAGFTMLFIAIGWWGLVGLVAYWFVVIIVMLVAKF